MLEAMERLGTALSVWQGVEVQKTKIRNKTQHNHHHQQQQQQSIRSSIHPFIHSSARHTMSHGRATRAAAAAGARAASSCRSIVQPLP